jgi:hypothetical protein
MKVVLSGQSPQVLEKFKTESRFGVAAVEVASVEVVRLGVA